MTNEKRAEAAQNKIFHLPAGRPLAIMQNVFRDLAKFEGKPVDFSKKPSANKADLSTILAPGSQASQSADSDGGVQIIPIIGAISRYDDFWAYFLGETSVEQIAGGLDCALADDSVSAIVLEIDSPGGDVSGIADLAAAIRAASQIKPVVAYVSYLGASAAYWIASAAAKIVVSRLSFVGSIGVYAAYVDASKFYEQAGVTEIEIVSSQSPDKNPDPSTDAGRALVQAQVDSIAELFVADVANYRQTAPENVLENFGKGDVVIAESAVSRGMADETGTLEDAARAAQSLANAQSNAQISAQAGAGIGASSKKTASASARSRGEKTMDEAEKNAAEISAEVRRQIAEEAQAGERERIKAIYRLATPSNMAIAGEQIARAMFDGKSVSGNAAEMILAAQEETRAKAQAGRREDAAKIPPVESAESPGKSSEEAKRKAAVDMIAPK